MALEGEAELTWRWVGSKEKHTVSLRKDSENPYLLKILPMTCHLVKNISNTVFVMAAFSTKEYNPKEPDKPTCDI